MVELEFEELRVEVSKTSGATREVFMKEYKVGDFVINGGGLKIEVQKDCLRCETFTGNKMHGKCNCCVKGICPGWKKSVRIHRSYISILNSAIRDARRSGSASITGLLRAKQIYEEHQK